MYIILEYQNQLQVKNKEDFFVSEKHENFQLLFS
jgi:hypothetical protein